MKKIILNLILLIGATWGGFEIFREIKPREVDRRPTITSVDGQPNAPSLGTFLGWSGGVSARGGFVLAHCDIGGRLVLALPGDQFSAKENDPVEVWRYSWCPDLGPERLEALVVMPAGSELWKGSKPPR